MPHNYELCFRTPQKRWIYVPTEECRLKGAEIIKTVLRKWSPHALGKAEQETLSKIYAILASFSASNVNFEQKIRETKLGQRTIYSNPAVSSFSDHIVISQPVKAEKNDDYYPVEITLTQVQNVIARVCYLALTKGFLIRGGITIGDLHQDKNIAFGRGLVDAYKIENNLSRYPRIVLSDELVLALTKDNKNYLARGKKLEEVAGPGVIRKDFDGLYYIDWINDWKFKLDDNGKQDWEAFGKKLEPVKKEIEKNLVGLKGQQAAYKNWHWMAGYYNSAIGNLAYAHGSAPPDPQYFPKVNFQD